MFLTFNLLFLLLLPYTPSWEYTATEFPINIHQLPIEGLLLENGWKIMPGDNSEWANPEWDDSDWQEIDPTLDIHQIPILWQSNVNWFRLRFSLDTMLTQESMTLLVEQTGASEIYLNGRLIGKYGVISDQLGYVKAAYPPFGEFISLQPNQDDQQVLAVRFALQKNLPYVNFADRYNRAFVFRIMEMRGVTKLIRGNSHFLDYVKSSIFFILSMLHLVLFFFSRGKKANLYFFIFSLFSFVNFLLSGFTFQHVQLAGSRMYLLTLFFLLFTSSSYFFLLAVYSVFKKSKSYIFWLLSTIFLLSLPLFLMFYQSGWILGLMIFPMLVFLETTRITLMADRNINPSLKVVRYGAVAFLVFYALYFTFHFGLFPPGPNWVFAHLSFNLGILSLPVCLSIFLATESSFTSLSLEAKILEIEKLIQQDLLMEAEKQKLLEMDGVKSRFFANLSHEFRTPLSLIRGTIEKLRRNDNTSPRRLADYLAIDKSAAKLLQMINQLLDLSKLEAGKITLNPVPVDIREVLKVSAASFSSLFESKGLIYRYTIPLKPFWVSLDDGKLEQIINNLLSNAAKFTPVKGEVNFTATIQNQDGHVGLLQIQVQDTGFGIASSQLPYIFDRFYQADNSLTRQHEGSGIGLALVKELVQLLGGQVGAKSKVGEGSIFTVDIPLAFIEYSDKKLKNRKASSKIPDSDLLGAVNEEKSNQHDKKIKNSHTILLVEDNTDLRLFIADSLSETYTVMEADNGLEGFRKASESIPDLIISDIMMPGLDGLSLCRKLKEDPRTGHIPIILLTAKADPNSKLEGLESGAEDYLTKPFSGEELQIRIDNLLRQREKLKGLFSRSFVLMPSEPELVSAEEEFLQKVLSSMEVNMDNTDFDVHALSRALSMSRANLNRKLNALTGQSPNEFIRTMRIKRAAHLLKHHQGNIGEISSMVGFSSTNYFTKCFKNYYGLTPSEYLISEAVPEHKRL